MYPNYIEDRKSLGYECLIDTQYGNRLVLITDSSVVFVKNVTLDGKREIFVIIAVMIIIFSDVKSAAQKSSSSAGMATILQRLRLRRGPDEESEDERTQLLRAERELFR